MEARFELVRPEGIEDAGWASVGASLDRLVRNFDAADHAAAIGSSKDLVETVAKVILVARGESPNGDVGPLISRVHASLDSSAAKGRAVDEPLRSMLTHVGKLIRKVPEMRNEAGTGHGRSVPPEVYEEHSSVTADATILWCRWALARYGEVHRTSPAWLVDALAGQVFYKGDVARHLADINLTRQPDGDLDRLGRALAQRGGWGGTGVVWRDGVGAAMREPAGFPPAFRLGLLFGLFFNRDGDIETSEYVSEAAAKLAAGLGDVAVLDDLGAELASARFASTISSGALPAIAERIRACAAEVPAGPLRERWTALAERFEPAPDDD